MPRRLTGHVERVGFIVSCKIETDVIDRNRVSHALARIVEYSQVLQLLGVKMVAPVSTKRE